MLLDEELHYSRDFAFLQLAGTVDVGGSHRATIHVCTPVVGVFVSVEGEF